jgi:fatty acid desaturase
MRRCTAKRHEALPMADADHIRFHDQASMTTTPTLRLLTGTTTLVLSIALPLFELPYWTWPLAWSVHWWLGTATLGYVGHLQAHRKLWRSRWANRIFESLLLLVSGMSVECWKITHVLGHHRAHWPALGRTMTHVYTGLDEGHAALRRYGLPAGLTYAATTLWAQWFGYLGFAAQRAGLRGGKAVRQALYRRALWSGATYIALMALLTWWQPLWACLFLWLPHLLTHFFSRYVDYLFHAGAQPSSDYLFCFTCVDRGYNRDAFNTGYHVAHHYWPRAAWQKLPTLHQRLCQLHPELRAAERATPFHGGRWLIQATQESGREARLLNLLGSS